jgi:DNA polymerase IIIc chi subunit
MNLSVTFLPVRNKSEKLETLLRIADRHFRAKEPLLFLVSDKESFEFLDRLLWRSPDRSFLPHPSKLLNIGMEPIPHTPIIFNLAPSPLGEIPSLRTIYELEDHTSPEKKLASEDKYRAYRDSGLHIIVEG